MVRNFLSKPIYHLLLILTLGILGYSNTLTAPFQFDDVHNIVENPIVKNLDYYITPTKAMVYNGLQEYPMLINRYIGTLTFALNYKINKLDVTGYHLVNILIHLINSLLVYWFCNLIFITLESGAGGDNPLFLKHASTIALFTSLLFVAHPIQTQAVTFIVQRFASLATMFYLFSMIMYIKYRLTFVDINNKCHGKKTSIRTLVYYLIALFTAVLAMKTKEIAFTLPAMIVLFEFLFFKGEIKSRILYLVPFILTMLIIPATLIYIVDLDGGVGTPTRLATDMPRFDYLFTEFRVIITYLRLVFFPVDQNLDYDYPLYHSIFEPEVFLSFLALLTICLTVIYSFWCYRKTQPLTRVICFGTAWFFATLSIESSIIPIVDVIFEHRMYLPSSGIFLVMSVLLVMVVIEGSRQKWVEGAIFLSVILTALVFTGITYARNNVWNDKIALWQDVVNKSPEKARGYIHLGSAYFEKKDHDKAIKYYKKAIFLDPSRSNAHANLGKVFDDLGRTNEAIKEYREALRIKPHNIGARINLGTALDRLGRTNEAIIEFREASRIKPHNFMTHNNLGAALGKLGRTSEAVKEFREAVQINPDSAEAHNNLGIGLGKLGRRNEAIKEFSEALRINPDSAMVRNNLEMLKTR
jgi:Flp pilus assembly protein TadD